MPTPKVAHSITTTWTPSGGSAYTIPVLDSSVTDSGDKLDATNSTSGGRQALMAGIARISVTCKFLFDTSAAFYGSTVGMRFGAKGTLATQFNGASVQTIYGMITSVGAARPCNGLITVDVTIEEDSITGTFAYPSS